MSYLNVNGNSDSNLDVEADAGGIAEFQNSGDRAGEASSESSQDSATNSKEQPGGTPASGTSDASSNGSQSGSKDSGSKDSASTQAPAEGASVSSGRIGSSLTSGSSNTSRPQWRDGLTTSQNGSRNDGYGPDGSQDGSRKEDSQDGSVQNGSSQDGLCPDLFQREHRTKQIAMVKERPEYKVMAADLPGRTGTPRADAPMSNRRFETERQMWHRSLHICAHARGQGCGKLRDCKIEEDDELVDSKNKRKKKETEREMTAKWRAAKLLDIVWACQNEPFKSCHNFLETLSDKLNELWLKTHRDSLSIAVTMADPGADGQMVGCCHRFAILTGHTLKKMLRKDKHFLRHWVKPTAVASVQSYGYGASGVGIWKMMRKVMIGEEKSFTCILPLLRAGTEKLRVLLHICSVTIPVHGESRSFVFGIHSDVTEDYINNYDLEEYEANAAQIASEAEKASLAQFS